MLPVVGGRDASCDSSHDMRAIRRGIAGAVRHPQFLSPYISLGSFGFPGMSEEAAWCPLRDSNPCFRRERAASWTTRRRGHETGDRAPTPDESPRTSLMSAQLCRQRHVSNRIKSYSGPRCKSWHSCESPNGLGSTVAEPPLPTIAQAHPARSFRNRVVLPRSAV